MDDEYIPPFTMTEEITDLLGEIAQYVGLITAFEQLHPNSGLRRENRIRSIHSSLAIEQNTLTLDQVTDVVNGKRIHGPSKDIIEVKNAYEVYNKAAMFDPSNVTDLLRAHEIMMNGLVKEAGQFRSGNIGVYHGDRLIHAGTPAHYVPDLIRQLFLWLQKSKYHPLIKSCVFHYEFEFIHPFADGNGRTGRLWQFLLLQKWQPVFAWLPIEATVHEHQDEYYRVLQMADNAGESTIFIEFMLRMICETLRQIAKTQNERQDVGTNVEPKEEKLLQLLRHEQTLRARKLAALLNLTQRQVERMLAKLKKEGRLIRHGASKNGYWEVVEQDKAQLD